MTKTLILVTLLTLVDLLSIKKIQNNIKAYAPIPVSFQRYKNNCKKMSSALEFVTGILTIALIQHTES